MTNCYSSYLCYVLFKNHNMNTLNLEFCESSILSCSNNQVDSLQPHARIVTLQTCVIPSDIRHRFNVFVEAVEKNCEKMHTVKE